MALVEINPASIRRIIEDVRRQYNGISGDILNQAVSRALNRTASQSRTEANRQIRKTFNISASRVNSEMRTRNSTARNMEAAILASGRPLSWNNFQARQVGDRATTSFDRKGVASSRLNRKSRTSAAKGVTAIIKKGQTINLPTAFIQVANGGITVFARGRYRGTSEGLEFSKERLPIAAITTLSIPMMFANNEVLEPTGRKATEILSDRIEHEIRWLLDR